SRRDGPLLAVSVRLTLSAMLSRRGARLSEGALSAPRARRLFAALAGAFVDAEFPGSAEGAREYVLVGRGKANVRVTHLSKTAGDGQEDIGRFFDERSLDFGSEGQVAVAFRLRSERSKPGACDAEGRQTGMGDFFDAFEAQGNPPEIRGSH